MYRRFGLPEELFDSFLATEALFDFALIGTGMTYWYPGVREVIERIRRRGPRHGDRARRPVRHALPRPREGPWRRNLVVRGTDLLPLWAMLGLAGDENQPPLWEAYPSIDTGAMRLTWGCPFRCTYCCVPKVYPKFTVKPLALAQAELELMISRGAQHVAFYDDALLHRPQEALVPFLEWVVSRREKGTCNFSASETTAKPQNRPGPYMKAMTPDDVRKSSKSPFPVSPFFHTPNAINARLLTPDLAGLMVRAGFGKIYLGFEMRLDGLAAIHRRKGPASRVGGGGGHADGRRGQSRRPGGVHPAGPPSLQREGGRGFDEAGEQVGHRHYAGGVLAHPRHARWRTASRQRRHRPGRTALAQQDGMCAWPHSASRR